MEQKKGYAYPEPMTRRRRAAVTIVAGIGTLAFGLGIYVVLQPWIEAYFAGLEELATRDPVAATRELLGFVSRIATAHGGVLVSFGLFLCHAGWQTFKAERWPYPGMTIHRCWKILDGRSARHWGRSLLAIGIVLALLGPALAWKMYSVVSTAIAAGRPKSGLQPPAQSAVAAPEH